MCLTVVFGSSPKVRLAWWSSAWSFALYLARFREERSRAPPGAQGAGGAREAVAAHREVVVGAEGGSEAERLGRQRHAESPARLHSDVSAVAARRRLSRCYAALAAAALSADFFLIP